MTTSLEAQRDRVLAGLKDFQRATAEFAFDRLYGSEDPTRRILIADEVGLGKTMVARGVIAKALAHLHGKVDRVDIVYICSNGDIARQNMNRLCFLGDDACAVRSATRLTLLARQIQELKGVNFIALTPNTSFDLGGGLGVASERAFIYWLLKAAWQFGGSAGPYNVLRGHADADNFRNLVDRERPDDRTLATVGLQLRSQLDLAPKLREEFDRLCQDFPRYDTRATEDQYQRRREFVGEVRTMLARTCVSALDPDLVILDEFQRFKNIMSGEDEAALLARTLFKYEDDRGNAARVLLLSATPYKMFTLRDVDADDDHYRDFLDTLKFLLLDDTRYADAEAAITQLRLELLRLKSGADMSKLAGLKQRVEAELRRVIVRTERLAATPDRAGMLQERKMDVNPTAANLRTYVAAQSIATMLKDRDVLEYWRASPYVLNFMDGYVLRDRMKEAAKDPDQSRQLASIVQQFPESFLSTQAARGGRFVPLDHARLQGLSDETVGTNAWECLWMPATLPYYRADGPFRALRDRGFTKRLVFSAWKMVPRASASLLSQLADVRTLERFEQAIERTTSTVERWPTPLLRIQEVEGRLTGLPLMLLLYPSLTLAECDPLRLIREESSARHETPSLGEVVSWAASQLQPRVDSLTKAAPASSQVDERWYWAAPVMLDLQGFRDESLTWLNQRNLSSVWQETEGDEESSWTQHVDQFRKIALEGAPLGRPPDDLLQILAEAAIASPAVCALRSFARSREAAATGVEFRNAAAAVAWAVRNLLNLPPSIALIRGLNKGEPYWRAALQYCASGDFQSVMDEYVHILLESLGLVDKTGHEVARQLQEAIVGALSVRAATVGADDIRIAEGGQVEIQTQRLTTRFAMAFGDSRAVDAGTEAKEGDITRAEKVRDAFNSPFWPFVLISTSVGQEGLDFHPYCHCVVHWNLPSNPVDLEQREGRVHRYKGHAVRKNVMKVHSSPALSGTTADVWTAAFEHARDGRNPSESDLTPYWVYPVDGGATIERCVPAIPLSREVPRYADLKRTLAIYRLVFGQPRQDDLISLLTSRLAPEEIDRASEELRIDLSPPKVAKPRPQ